jgi:hypothetical protein
MVDLIFLAPQGREVSKAARGSFYIREKGSGNPLHNLGRISGPTLIHRINPMISPG